MAGIDHEVRIAADETDDSRSEVESSTTSVSSSLLDYRIENGRTYHKYKDGKYTWPNDDREAERLDMQHELYVYTLDGRLGLAPPCDEDAKVGRVLDLGTGTGIWAIDFGDLHPESEVLGMDLSHTQPGITVPNVTFEIDDLEEEWTYSRPFDYIHSRAMTSAVADWKALITKAFDNLNPGGWLELQEGDVGLFSDDDTFPKDCAFAKMADLLKEACAKLGRPWIDLPSLKDIMIEVGFVDVKLSFYKWPINDWPKAEHYKNIGTWAYDNVSSALEAMCMAPFTRGLDWTRDELNIFLIDVRKDMKNKQFHAYYPIYIITGRKPEKKDEKTPAA
ncbi:methyltransferase domain-containing protein [Colletotrichum karsti]|uniref:Methyltransferase domain-containing protein n=1 Tax=Colletotrichum karsti TaxID=1095194 RepID=A0A9P6LDR0_9PEZI|nr:methyltransferase domain-containing protein [Colletotrichum karsti]KAF9872204.1 methyltransferase domain-containing protein [Colletotrichum karsti]